MLQDILEGISNDNTDADKMSTAFDQQHNQNQNGSSTFALPQTATGLNSTDSEEYHKTDSTPVSEGDGELRMLKMVNLKESGLRRSYRIPVVPESVQTSYQIDFTSVCEGDLLYCRVMAQTSSDQIRSA